MLKKFFCATRYSINSLTFSEYDYQREVWWISTYVTDATVSVSAACIKYSVNFLMDVHQQKDPKPEEPLPTFQSTQSLVGSLSVALDLLSHFKLLLCLLISLRRRLSSAHSPSLVVIGKLCTETSCSTTNGWIQVGMGWFDRLHGKTRAHHGEVGMKCFTNISCVETVFWFCLTAHNNSHGRYNLMSFCDQLYNKAIVSFPFAHIFKKW